MYIYMLRLEEDTLAFRNFTVAGGKQLLPRYDGGRRRRAWFYIDVQTSVLCGECAMYIRVVRGIAMWIIYRDVLYVALSGVELFFYICKGNR